MSFLLKKLKLVSFLTRRIPAFGFAQWKRGLRDRDVSYAAMELAGVLPPGLSVIVDVGAHAGVVSEALDFLYKPRRIWVVEPNPLLGVRLDARFKSRPTFRVIKSCLGEAPGEATFYVHDFDAASSLYECKPGHLASFGLKEGRKQVRVQVATLADVLKDEPGPIDLLKLDCQGSELSVLKGAADRLGDIRWIYCEVSIDPIYDGAPLWGDVHAFLRKAGFELRKVDGYAGSGDSIQWGDALYANVSARSVQ